ncbi:MAG: protocatechuate 4,5-dioxygenase subunit alpha [Sphingomonadales bacterium]|nr:MAG: protocatechuate 4,5-dioxygenase subunit alpha [Sphingomonadales bacterium]
MDIAAYLEELEDIPGTYVFTARRARQGYHLNQCCMSLMKAENRARWHADEAAYLADWKLTDAQRDALLARNYGRLLELGGNIYFLAKVIACDGQSFVQGVSTMSGMSLEDYQAMMMAGGRSPEGMRSKREQAALAAVAEAAGEIVNSPIDPAR